MGQTQSKSRNELTVDTSLAISATANFIQNQTATTDITTLSTQEFTFVNYGKVKDVDISQKINMDKQTSGDLNATSRSQLETQLKSAMDAAVTQASQAKAGWLATASTSTENINKYKSAVSTAVATTMTQESYSAIRDSTISKQKAQITNYGVLDNVKVDQNIVARILAVNIMKNVFDNANKILADQSTGLKIKQSAESTSTGADSVLNMLTSTAGMVSSCISSVACVLIIALLLVLLSPAGQEGIETLATAKAGGI